jgi:hypothetical protein
MTLPTHDAVFKAINKTLLRFITVSVFLAFSGSVQANVYDEPYIHEPAFPILDEEGNNVLDSGQPYSSKQTCGGCHDYDVITHAFHIEAGRDEMSDDYGEKHGISLLISPGYAGGYNCMGGNNPSWQAKKSNSNPHDFADLGTPGMVKGCAYCHSGGGWMEKDRNGNRFDEVDPTTVTEFDGEYFNRGTDENNNAAASSVVSQWNWKKSGVVENDCLLCHVDITALKVVDPELEVTGAASTMLRTMRITALINQGHFREANSTILEILNLNLSDDESLDKTLLSFDREDKTTINHMTGAVEPADGIITPEELAYKEDKNGNLKPHVTWNAEAFNADGKAEVPMLRFPANDNCMMCHRTSNSRRGFYGFGEGAEAIAEEETGVLVEDYQDDVHKGKIWREDNGEERTIENCNACHSRNYFNPPSASADVDASHDFLKGNSDMDVHNDMDYNPNAKSCEYCHEQSPQAAELANPSGDADMLTAHKKVWTLNGDMSGYPESTLEQITQTHLDVVSCQACHITGKAIKGVSFDPVYRYREAENGDLTIVPYKPKARYLWKDKNSGTVLNRAQRNSVFQPVKDSHGTVTGGQIVDPETGAVLGEVTAGFSHGSVRFNDPDSYEGFKGLKQAYDKVFKISGIENADAILVWSEINQYLLSHNTRPAVSSVQCEQCHNYKADGTTISALVSDDGIFGKNNSYVVTTVPDPRLVIEGIVTFDAPYMKMDAETGAVTANVSDILADSIVNPSMSALRSAIAVEATSIAKTYTNVATIEEGMSGLGISNSDDAAQLADQFRNSKAHMFQVRQGDESIRQVAVISGDDDFAGYVLQVELGDTPEMSKAAAAGFGSLSTGAEVFALKIKKQSGSTLATFAAPVWVKLPYRGSSSSADQVNVITSIDGEAWAKVDPADIQLVRAATDMQDGYIVFKSSHFSYYTTTEVAAKTAGSTAASSGASGSAVSRSGGGSMGLFFILLNIMLLTLHGKNRLSPFRG